MSRLPWSQPRCVVRVEDPGQVAAEVIRRIGEPAIQRLDLRVRTWERPPGWIGAPGLSAIRGLHVSARRGGGRVRIRLGRAMDPGLVLAGALRVLRPEPARGIGPEISFAPGLPAGAAALAGRVVSVADGRRDAHLRVHDVVLAPPGGSVSEGTYASVVTVGGDDWPVDLRVHNPIGRDVQSVGPPVVCDIEPMPDGSWLVRSSGLRLGRDVSSADVRALRGIDILRVDGGWLADRRVDQLRAAGLLVIAEPVPPDPLDRRVVAHDHARIAMRRGATQGSLGGWPSVSALVLTHRLDFLEHLVSQVASLEYPELEILVGLHGIGGSSQNPDALIERVAGMSSALPEHQVRVIAVDANLPFGAALQYLSEHANGELLTKLDDDDWYSPEHIWDLVLAREYSGATIVGKALDWIEVRSAPCTVYRPVYRAETYATFVAGGTLLISSADLRGLGGWRPVAKSVDRALLERARAHGALVYRTSGLGYCYVRHDRGHTAQVRDEHFLMRTEGRWPGLLAHAAIGTSADIAGDSR